MMTEKEKKPSIIFYIGSLSRGGAERVIVNLAEYFHANDYHVTIVTKMREKVEYDVSDGIDRVIADITEEEITGSRLLNLYRRIKKLRNIFKQIHPEHIVSFIGKNNLMAIAASRGLRIPVTVSVRSDPKREYPGRANRILVPVLFGMAEGIVLQTTQAKEYFNHRIGKKAVILPNPLNYRFIKPFYDGERRKEIVWVGRMDDNKNPKLLVDAFSEICKDYPEWKVIFYGDGDNAEQIKKFCDRQNLGGQIVFAGKVDHVEEKIDQSSIYVLTSKIEGMPNALMEAMALGIAPIATDCPCGGPAQLIQNRENGILIPVDDKQALKQALRELMEDTTLRQKISVKAYEILEKVHPDVVNKQWMDYIEQT